MDDRCCSKPMQEGGPTAACSPDDELAALAKAIAHPARVQIVRSLRGRDSGMCGDIVDRVCYRVEPAALDRLKSLVAGLQPAFFRGLFIADRRWTNSRPNPERDHARPTLDAVRSKYGAVALGGLSTEHRGVRAVAEAFGYTAEELASIPAAANLGLSCGNPTATARLHPGETVVDLGSGGGLDVFLAARTDLNAHAKVENQVACCAPPMASPGLAVVEPGRCCTPAGPGRADARAAGPPRGARPPVRRQRLRRQREGLRRQTLS